MCCARQASAVEPIRIMPLGDSITRGSSYAGDFAGSYRTQLWKDLKTAGYAVDFVGESTENPDPANSLDPDHNGYNGWRIDQIDASIVSWLKKEKPAVVLLHLGTNDAIQNYAFSSAPTRLSNLISHITAESPQTHVIVAKIIKSTDSTTNANVNYLNGFVSNIVATHAANHELVTMVDMNSVVSTSQLSDPYHPNRSGYDAMGDAWFGAIQSLGAITNPAETPEPGTAFLGISGLVAMGLYVWQRRKS
jgi:lysophospholipase L1-like esterase